jgi:hypothetical protein
VPGGRLWWQKLQSPAASASGRIAGPAPPAARPGPASAACARPVQPSQMNAWAEDGLAPGHGSPASSFRTCCWVWPQNEQDR